MWWVKNLRYTATEKLQLPSLHKKSKLTSKKGKKSILKHDSLSLCIEKLQLQLPLGGLETIPLTDKPKLLYQSNMVSIS